MKLLKQNGPHCLVYSAAMILDEDPNILHKEIGTDGTEIWWPPTHTRGIHIQEIQDCCIRRGKCLYNVEKYPLLCPDSDIYIPLTCINDHTRFFFAIDKKRAILITDNHAVAWDGHNVYDPTGFVESYSNYEFTEAWILGSLI